MLRSLVSKCMKLPVTQGNGLVRRSAFLLREPRCLHGVSPTKSQVMISLCRKVSHSSVNGSNTLNGEKLNENSDQLQEQEERIKEARNEVENLLAIGWQAPESISDFDLEHYLTLTSKKARKKFLRFLFKKQMLKRREKMKKEERARLREKSKEEREDTEEDGPIQNRLFLRLQNNTILQFDMWKLAAGMMFGPKIVYDFSYEEFMRRQEVTSLVQQLMHALNANKHAKDPFSIHWVGLTEETQSLQQLRRLRGDSLETTLVTETDKDLLEVFPKDKLVYLSSDSPNVLKSYDSDKVYVIGALVDSHIIYTGQSLARAKRHGIDHARLPLDKHLHWTTGAKNLTLDQMMKILIEMNTSGDWVKALQHVPIRKHAGLRSGPLWDQDSDSSPGWKTRKRDSIERNPSQFVSSRARKSQHSNLESQDRVSDRRQKKRIKKSEEEDDTDSTLFSSRAGGQASWFDDDK